MTIRDHVPATDGPFAMLVPQLEGSARHVVVEDALGLHHGYESAGAVLAEVLVTPSAARMAELSAEHAAWTSRRTAIANNESRVGLLARQAARFAKDPVANATDQLTPRLQHELLARLALAQKADE